jgi:tRNA pseudouridine38-40 synthase
MALVVEYDGGAYVGFQWQSHQPTIQGALETALSRFTGESLRVRGASRTDSGAHAQGQVVDFLTESLHPPATFVRALNFYLPTDIRVQTAHDMAPEFHRPEAPALYRQYHHWVPEELDLAAMNAGAQALVGCHDFRPLSLSHPQEKSAVRQVYRWTVGREGDTVTIECEANGFLRHQIRRANAILVEIGKGKWPKAAIEDILEGNSCDTIARPSLPANGLCLVKVNYQNCWAQVRTSDETD